MKQTIDIDIVDRLRINWTSMTDMGNEERAEAAEEIERLRNELVRNTDEFAKTLTELRQRMETLTAERDEARRSCCEYAAIVDGADTTEGIESGRFYEIAMNYMKDRGWDCFKDLDEPVRNADEFRETLTELQQRVETLTAERDEARKLVVESIYKGTARKRDIAKARGWTDLYPDDDYDMEGDVE